MSQKSAQKVFFPEHPCQSESKRSEITIKVIRIKYIQFKILFMNDSDLK